MVSPVGTSSFDELAGYFRAESREVTQNHISCFPYDRGLVFMTVILPESQSLLAELLGIFVKSVATVFFSLCVLLRYF